MILSVVATSVAQITGSNTPPVAVSRSNNYLRSDNTVVVELSKYLTAAPASAQQQPLGFVMDASDYFFDPDGDSLVYAITNETEALNRG